MAATESAHPDAKTSTGVEELASLGVRARTIERPTKEKEAQQILARAFQEKRTVLPCGGGTAMGAGILPESVDIALDMTAMNRVLVFDPQNLNLAVLGGITIDAINKYLADQAKGFFLPLDPPFSHRATIGGVYAANSSGPLRLRYGAVRDQVLGVRGADAMGREIGFGGKTVKNVSGYDLTKFFIGSGGSLGLITSISFRVYPLPEAASLCDLIFDAVEGLEKFLAVLRKSVWVPSAVTVTEISAMPGGPGRNGPRYRVLIGFEGHGQAVERQNRDLLKLGQEFGGRGDARLGREQMVHALRSAVNPDWGTGELLTLKISVPVSRGVGTLAALQKFSKEMRTEVKTVLFAGNGILLMCAGNLRVENAPRFLTGVKEIGKAAEGFTAPVCGSRTFLAAWGSRVEPSISHSILRPLKEKLDPAGIFPPVIA
ncbi:MAG: FAD-binding oxidoreductase [Deltaproteobacteria bacterium]|nr:MAG: FAD-binding oxidoreductase [Deltaproteobacteria bacterium]